MSLLWSRKHSTLRLVVLAFPLIGVLGGCADSNQVDPNIKVEAGKSVEESVAKQSAGRGAVKHEPGPKQRVGMGGPD
jgi:hypothetical protein